MINPFKSELANNLFHVALYGIGFSSIAAVVWLAGPLIEIGGYRPLENYVVREMVVLVIGAMVVSAGSLRFYRRRKGAEQIAKGISGEGEGAEATDADVLKDKMKDALATLKAASGGKAGFLYDLPWYVLIGPPGSGKTTALVNCGLKFPLSRGATPAAVAGVGGTRYCDWWFTEDAVLIDTAGRYTTQDSDAKADRESWFAFLDLLKKSRPRQPINGVLVVISIEDLMTLGPAEINAHANAIRARLLDLHGRLKVDFPVYALFTKGDLVAGFTEFFATLGEEGRRQVWGATFQTADKTRNLVGEVPVEYDALVERMNVELTDRLQEEPVPSARVTLFGLPAQMARLKRPIFDFLNQIFEPTRYHANATLRGFYFTSGTQQGTPIDQLIGALVKTFGAEEVTGYAYSGMGKSFFLTHLIRKVIIGEAAWVSTDSAAVRRARIIKAAAISALVVVSAVAAGTWWTSYARNRALIKETDEAVAEYRAIAGPLATQNVISDRDFSKVLPPLHKLRHLPSGYETHGASVPLLASFGLSQHERLRSASEATYRRGLERMFRPRLVYRLEELLEANKGNPSFIYEALKVYLMLGGLQPADRDLILNWERRDWSDNLYPGAANTDGRKALEDHLIAMLDLEEGQDPLITLHGPLIQDCQAILARLNVAQRAYELLKSQARNYAEDWVAARHGGPDFDLVFEAADGSSVETIRVPGFYTYAGFHRAFIDRLGGVAEQVRKDLWVLGEAGKQSAVTAQYDSLGPDLLDIYTKDYINTWRQTLPKLRLKRLNADKPKYIALSAVSAATSPLKQLLESIRDETALTRDRPGFGPAANAKPGDKPAETKVAETSPLLLKLQDRAPGASIEAAFKAYHLMVEGDAARRPIDGIVANLNEINQSLILAATNPAQTSVVNQQLQTQVATLRTNATRMPPPFDQMLLTAAGNFEGDLTNSQVSQLAQAMGSQVTGICEQTVNGRYPFERKSDRDIQLTDFAKLFAPTGVIDRFFTQSLAPYADTSKAEWTWRQDSPTARALSPATLRQFQRAQQIRDAFFPVGGNMPTINMSVTPPPLAGPGVTAKLEIHGTPVVSQQGLNPPVNATWPGSSMRTALTLGTELPGAPPSVLERNGPWSLFKMLDVAATSGRAEKITAGFLVGGRELQYQITTGSSRNPFTLSALREFRCPSGL